MERLPVKRNRDLVLAFDDAVFNGHDISAIDRFMSVDVLNLVTGTRGREQSVAVVRYVLAGRRSARPFRSAHARSSSLIGAPFADAAP